MKNGFRKFSSLRAALRTTAVLCTTDVYCVELHLSGSIEKAEYGSEIKITFRQLTIKTRALDIVTVEQFNGKERKKI